MNIVSLLFADNADIDLESVVNEKIELNYKAYSETNGRNRK